PSLRPELSWSSRSHAVPGQPSTQRGTGVMPLPLSPSSPPTLPWAVYEVHITPASAAARVRASASTRRPRPRLRQPRGRREAPSAACGCWAAFRHSSGGIPLEEVDHLLTWLAHFDYVAVRVPHVASGFPTVVVEGFGQEFGPPALPFRVAGLNVGDAEIQKAVDTIRVRRRLKGYRRLVRRWSTTIVENHPGVGQLDDTRTLQ